MRCSDNPMSQFSRLSEIYSKSIEIKKDLRLIVDGFISDHLTRMLSVY